jgi:hypothetical protein
MKAKKVKDVLEGGPAMVSGLPKLLPKEGRDESVLDRADRIRDEDDVKFIEVREELNFERGQEPKEAMAIGRDQFKQPGDEELTPTIFIRRSEEGNSVIFTNRDTGKSLDVGLYAMQEVRKALRELT